MTIFKNLWNDESGASAAEYALILAVIGTGIAVAAVNLGGAIEAAIQKGANCVAGNCNTTYTKP
jgi:pilus assembly protein Flp/PilA